MNYIISAATDVGLTKSTNQDSLTVKIMNTSIGRMVFALVCDGMGGLEKGEVASRAMIEAFDGWIKNELPGLLAAEKLEDSILRRQWEEIVTEQNRRIKTYGARQGVKLGTTVVAMLLTENRYYILNVGDSRAYEITDRLVQVTEDQTFVAREVALGNMTPEQAMVDERRNVLLQCVGASDEVYPEMFFGETKTNAVYMLCSDGFRHVVVPEEIYEKFQPGVLFDENRMYQNALELIELNKMRNETDNISVALVRTF